MKTILNIGSIIKNLLSNNKELNKLIKGQIYPLVAPENTTFPFIVYRRDSTTSNNKDMRFDNANVEIIVASDRYDESIEVAELVRNSMKIKNQTINDFHIQKIDLINTSEYFQDAYLQSMTFSAIINSI